MLLVDYHHYGGIHIVADERVEVTKGFLAVVDPVMTADLEEYRYMN